MSRTYQALKKAERRRVPLPRGPADERRSPRVVADMGGDDVELQFERIQLWLANRTPREEPIRTIMVASCEHGNGATTTAVRLACTAAERATARVLIVDANIRTPALDLLFGARAGKGFSDLMAEGDAGKGDCIQPTNRPNLFVLTTGRLASPPVKVFEPATLSRLVARLRAGFDFVVFDAPPLLKFPDGHALAPYVDAVLLVVEAERTLIESAQRVVRDLDRAGVRPVGIVLNRQRDYVPRFLRRLVAGL